MKDNKTSQAAHAYDSNIEKTIPMYNLFNEQTIDLIKAVAPDPDVWLDTGCGTGILVSKAGEVFPKTRFILSDPSEAMLDISKAKMLGRKINTEFILAGTENLRLPEESIDVITAVMSHHYFDIEARREATGNCFRMLKKGGVFITFETIKPQTEKGQDIGLRRWRRAQVSKGKAPEEAEKHISRYGTELLPVSIESHLKLLYETGFSVVEIFWASVMQAGFYALK